MQLVAKRFFRWYFKASLILRIIVCFTGVSLIGAVLWNLSEGGTQTTDQTAAEKVIPYISPFGQVFVHMLKMIVVPIDMDGVCVHLPMFAVYLEHRVSKIWYRE